MRKNATKKEIEAIRERFKEHYGEAETELAYKNLYELLVAVMLSAQCTDKRVNIITPALFERYPSPAELAIADLEEVKSYLNTCSFFNNKAKNLIKMANAVMQEFEGEIPLDEKALQSLAGVGQKTANVVMIEFTKANLMAVDTHVFRVSHRLGLSYERTAIKTEEELTKKFKTDLHVLHQAMVLYGRYICKSKSPLCDTECFMQEFCRSKEPYKPA